jgi:hypothetical protein
MPALPTKAARYSLDQLQQLKSKAAATGSIIAFLLRQERSHGIFHILLIDSASLTLNTPVNWKMNRV